MCLSHLLSCLLAKIRDYLQSSTLIISNLPVIGDKSSEMMSLNSTFKCSSRNVELLGFEVFKLSLSGNSSVDTSGMSSLGVDLHSDIDFEEEYTCLVLHAGLLHTEQEDIDLEE